MLMHSCFFLSQIAWLPVDLRVDTRLLDFFFGQMFWQVKWFLGYLVTSVAYCHQTEQQLWQMYLNQIQGPSFG